MLWGLADLETNCDFFFFFLEEGVQIREQIPDDF